MRLLWRAGGLVGRGCCRTANKFNSRQLAHIFREPQDAHPAHTPRPRTYTHPHPIQWVREMLDGSFGLAPRFHSQLWSLQIKHSRLCNSIQKCSNYLFKFVQTQSEKRDSFNELITANASSATTIQFSSFKLGQRLQIQLEPFGSNSLDVDEPIDGCLING